MGGRFSLIAAKRSLVASLVEREVKARYKRSAFGLAWAFVEPLLMVAIYYLVFGRIIRLGVPRYPLFLVTGIFCYQYFSSALTHGVLSIVANGNLVKKVYFPREIFPLAVVLGRLVHLVIALLLWVAILALFFDVLSPTLYLLPAALLLATVTLASLAMVAAACHVYFSDTGFLVNFLLLAVFYLTPAVYPLSYIPEGWKVLYLLNPAASQVELLRAIVLGFPEATAPLLWCVLAGQAAVFLPLGYLAFLPLEKRMGEVL
jgi:ABC-type polysaccharide/polyol phosphate export permease